MIQLWWKCFLSQCFATLKIKKKELCSFHFVVGCCPFLFVTSQYQLHADTARASWAAVLLRILLWFRKCVCTEPATSQELLLPLGLCKDLNSALCMSSTACKQWDKIWNHRKKLFCIQRPGFPGAVLFPQYPSAVRVSRGGHHPAAALILHAVFNIVNTHSWKSGCQLLIWDFFKKYWGLG